MEPLFNGTFAMDIFILSLTHQIFHTNTYLLKIHSNIVQPSVPVLALPAAWARFLRRPLTAIQTLTKKAKDIMK